MNFPPENILKPRGITRKNYEHIIFWMLCNNDSCTWADLSNEPINIPEATLSRYLDSFQKKKQIEKISRGQYKVSSEGKKRYYEISKSKRKQPKVNYPPRIITEKGRNYEHWILWMVYNNEYCRRSDFTKGPLFINQNALSKNLNYLIEGGYIQKTDYLYKITQSGKVEYSKMLYNYDLDRQTILEEESKRIDEIAMKNTQFFEEYKIKDEEVKFRYLNKVLRLDYSKVNTILADEHDFYKILLFISINHPSFYPKYLSLDKFSNLYRIKKKVLDYWIDEILSGNIYDLKIHRLVVPPDKVYYFEANQKMEKMFRAICKNHITKSKYLQKFGYPYQPDLLLNNILKESCEKIFHEDLMEALRDFLPGYIKHLAYKIETKRELKDTHDKLEGIVWQDMANLFYSQGSDTLEDKYHDELIEIERVIALDPMDYESYSEKIRILLYYNQYTELLDLLDGMLLNFPEKEIDLLMKKASILKMNKDVSSGLDIIDGLISKYPKNLDLQNYKAYWLKYLGKKEEAIEIIQKLINDNPKNALFYDTLGEILLYFGDFKEASTKFLKVIVLKKNSWFIYQTYVKLASCYLALNKFDLAEKNLEMAKNLIHKNVSQVETKQNWLTITDLLLAEVMEQRNEL